MTARAYSGIKLSIGHSGATYDQARESFARGVSQVTHTFNGMAGIHHRQPGILVAASEEPAVTFQIIADGVHVHPAVIRFLIRLVGVKRVLAISDAMRATGLPDGDYSMGEVATRVMDGIARDAGGSLAGSTLTMDQALCNLMQFCGMSLAEALPMLTRAPAQSIGLYPRKGALLPGSDADILLWDAATGLRATLIGGELVHCAESPQPAHA